MLHLVMVLPLFSCRLFPGSADVLSTTRLLPSSSQIAPVIRPARMKPATHMSFESGIFHSTPAITRQPRAITPTSGRLTSIFVESEFGAGCGVDMLRLCRDLPASRHRPAKFETAYRIARKAIRRPRHSDGRWRCQSANGLCRLFAAVELRTDRFIWDRVS